MHKNDIIDEKNSTPDTGSTPDSKICPTNEYSTVQKAIIIKCQTKFNIQHKWMRC